MSGSRNPGAAARARAELVRDPARSSRLIAAVATCDPGTVRRVRRDLEAAGTIPRAIVRVTRIPPPRKPGRTRLAVEAGYRTTREIMAVARVSRTMACRALNAASTAPPLPGAACRPVTLRGPLEFPVGWQRESPAAVRICTRYCPCLKACAAWALTQPDTPAVLGGLTRDQRRSSHTGSNG